MPSCRAPPGREHAAGPWFKAVDLGEGVVPLPAAVQRLRELGYDGTVSPEYEGPEEPYAVMDRAITYTREAFTPTETGVSRLRYSHDAEERMVEQGITRQMVETVLSAPGTVIEGETADEYNARVGDRIMRIVVARERHLVITVYWVAT